MEKIHPGIVMKTLLTAGAGLLALLGAWWLAGVLTWSDVARVMWSLLVIAPAGALLIGAGAALWGLSLWPALSACLLATVVGVVLRFTEDSLVYVPVYLGLAAAGYVLGHVIRGRQGESRQT